MKIISPIINFKYITRNLIRLWHEYGLMFRFWLGPMLYVVAADAKHVEHLLNSTSNISKSMNYRFLQPWLGTGLLTATGSKWKFHRKILTPTFHFKILEKFLHVFNYHGNILVQKLKKEVKGPEFDMHKYITLCALDVILEAAMGARMNMQDDTDSEYVSALKNLAEIVLKRSIRPWLFPDFIFNLSEMGRKQKKYLQVLHNMSRKIIASKKEEFSEEKDQAPNEETENVFGQKRRLAFLDLLLQYNRDGGTLHDGEIQAEVDTFMFEGHDTVSSGLGFCVWLLAHNPLCQDKAFSELRKIFGDSDRDATVEDLQEMKYLECVVKETLRLYPSVALFLRELDEDVKLEDVELAAGTTVLIFPYAMHRNPEYFPEPETFDPERFSAANAQGRNPYAYVPFSAGPRNCIGQRFAMMEMKALMSKLLRNFKFVPGSKEMVVSSELVLRKCGGINIKLEYR